MNRPRHNLSPQLQRIGLFHSYHHLHQSVNKQRHFKRLQHWYWKLDCIDDVTVTSELIAIVMLFLWLTKSLVTITPHFRQQTQNIGSKLGEYIAYYCEWQQSKANKSRTLLQYSITYDYDLISLSSSDANQKNSCIRR